MTLLCACLTGLLLNFILSVLLLLYVFMRAFLLVSFIVIRASVCLSVIIIVYGPSCLTQINVCMYVFRKMSVCLGVTKECRSVLLFQKYSFMVLNERPNCMYCVHIKSKVSIWLLLMAENYTL